jgi:DNA-binding NarL/FixJ family response regulator
MPLVPIRILVVDDHTLVRAGIKALLEDLPNVCVVGEAGCGVEAIRQVLALKPDLVLMDIAMPELNGIEASRRIKEVAPDTRIILVSMHLSEEYVVQALSAGASGYLLKDSAARELELAVDAVFRGNTYLSPPVSRQVVDGYVKRVSEPAPRPDPLTPRQRQILKLIALGNSTKEIAFKLNLSAKTVETHRAQLMERLDIHEIAGLVKYALRVGLIDAHE